MWRMVAAAVIGWGLMWVAGCDRATIGDGGGHADVRPAPPGSRDAPSIRGDAEATSLPPLPTDGTKLPDRLSQTGVFLDLRSLTPRRELVPYELNVPFWSDGAAKRRWVALPPDTKVRFAVDTPWRFPPGTVLVKHFEYPLSGQQARRLETRVLVVDRSGAVAGAAYRWRADERDADRVGEGGVGTIDLDSGDGDRIISNNAGSSHSSTFSGDGDGSPGVAPRAGRRSLDWYFPSPQDCAVCHTPAAGSVLGLSTRQLNRPIGKHGDNQLVTWERAGRLDRPIGAAPAQLPRLVPADDRAAPVELRARSYLDANCGQCHRPGGAAGNFDARFETPLGRQNLIDGPVLIDLGIDRARVIAPRDPWRSLALVRVETGDQTRMPPLAHQRVDARGAALLREWIDSLPGPRVLPPPTIAPAPGEYAARVRVELSHPEPDVVLRYTLDGSAPAKSSPAYSGPFELTEPATVRVRAYKEGMTRSVAVQATFVVGGQER